MPGAGPSGEHAGREAPERGGRRRGAPARRPDAVAVAAPEQVEAIALVDGLYLRASEAFWRREGAAADSVADFGKQWVKADPAVFGSELTTLLAPGLLARALDPRPGERAKIGEVEQVTGVEVRPMRVGTLTAYVTTAEPHRIVRLTSTDGPAASGAPSPGTPSALTGRGLFARAQMPGRAPGSTGFAVDVEELTDDQVNTLFNELTQKIGGLKDSLDSQVRFSLTGAITLAPCTTNGCQANVTIANRVQTNSPYLSAQQPVTATVTIAMTLDARPINTCSNSVTMPPNGSVTTTCFAAYVIPPSRNPRTHIVEAQARAVARALVQADVDRLIKDLDAEFARYRRNREKKPTPTTTRPGFATPTANTTPTRTGKAAPTADPSPTTDKECEIPPVLTGSGIRHTKDRRYKNGREFRNPREDSEWTVGVERLPQLVQASHAAPGRFQHWTGRCERVLDAADIVGTKIPGVPTRQYSVIHLTDDSGDHAPRPAREIQPTMMHLRVEDMNHEVLDRLSDENNAFTYLCQRVHGDSGDNWRVLNIIDPYSDTMLNRVQQLMLRSELDAIRQRPDLLADAEPLVEKLSAALERALKIGGYLTFVGN